MKKLITFSIFVMLITLLLASPVLALPGKGAVKGEVTVVDEGGGTVTIETNKGDTVTVDMPDDFDFATIEVGDSLLVKSTGAEGVAIEAEWVKQVGKGRGKGDDEEKAEGKKEHSAYCVEGKPRGHVGQAEEKEHPLSEKIGEHFPVPEGWVMEQFCDGYSMGAIMLALKTSELEGSDPGDLLEGRANGNGWGQIWKGLGLIGSEKEGHSPPGLLKKPEKAGKKED